MEAKDLALAVIPPILAIAIEAFNPFNTAYFQRAANAIIRNEIADPNDTALSVELRQATAAAERLLAGAAEGAASLVGITPTFVSFVTAGIAIVELRDTPDWWIIWLFVGTMIVALPVWRMLSARDILGVATRTMDVPLMAPKTASQVCSWSVYGLNTVLIVLAFVVFTTRPTGRAVNIAAGTSVINTEAAPRPLASTKP